MSSITRPKIYTNLLTSAKLQFSTSSVASRSHYDTLGITPKATQNDIKSAYYKLTKLYHPDKNQSEEAKQKFRNITDAYEILSNYKSRKMYDRGMRPHPRHMENRSEEEIRKEDAQTRFYKSRLTRSRVPAPSGRTPIYNFDEWAKAHYGQLFNESMKAKETWETVQKQCETEELKNKDAKLWSPILLLIIMGTIWMTSNIEHDYDSNKLNSKKKDP